ncbi:MAG: winged helix-turn-helix domain-containing tetratricopeptide repeat protein, partial [Gammaproteobacteria bacterium]
MYKFGPFRLNVVERLLFREGLEIPLSAKSFDLLLVLIENAGHLKSRDELVETLWPKTIVGEHNLTSNLSALRKALGDEGNVPQYIQTVRSHGYRFIAPVITERLGPEAATPAAMDRQTLIGVPPRRRTGIAIGVAALVLVIVAAGVLASRLSVGPASGQGAHASLPVIAVLPFANLSADKTNAYLTEGIQDTILTRLAGIGGFRVISRTSTESYTSRPGNLKRVTQQLGATTVLEGSVQKAGDRVQVNVQLIDARTDTHIWAETYSRTLEDVFEVEGNVATQVAAALEAKLLPAEAARLTQPLTRDPQAYLLFLKANHYANQTSDRANVKDPTAAVTRAIALYRQAIARDPHFALAYAHLSLLESYAYWFEIDPTPHRIADAERTAKRALALELDLPQAHLAMGYVEYYGHRNYAAALSQFKQAAQNLPHNADVIGAMAYIHRRQGKWQQSLAGLAQAARLDPRNPRWPNENGLTLMALRRYGEAIQQFDQALAIEPDDYDAATHKIAALFLMDEPEQARRALSQIPHDVDPQGLTSTLRFETAWFARDPDRALAALDSAPTEVEGPNTLGEIPKSLFQAQALSLKGDSAGARQAYTDARKTLQAMLRTQADNPDPWGSLGLAEAGLGEKAAAIQAGRRAT